MGLGIDGAKPPHAYGAKKGKNGGGPAYEMPAFTAELTAPFPPVGAPVKFDKLLYNGLYVIRKQCFTTWTTFRAYPGVLFDALALKTLG